VKGIPTPFQVKTLRRKEKELSSENQQEKIMVSFKNLRWHLSNASERVRLDGAETTFQNALTQMGD
jgi:hypothetical protein